MTSNYNHSIALKIYEAIAQSKNGLDLEQLQARIPSPKKRGQRMALNTLRSYCRWLKEDGAIEIGGIHSDAANRPVKNLYIAIREPQPRLTDAEKLKQIIELLEPYTPQHRPDKWDAGYKANIQYAILDAVSIALGKISERSD